MARWTSALLGDWVLLAPAWAMAAEPSGEKFPDAEPPLSLLPTPEDALIDPKMARSWAVLPPRAFVATTVDGLYIATNHLLASQTDRHDPVAQTVSLAVPAWMDFLHLRFSHHTEHHLYPGAGPANYPAVRQALMTHCPDRYHRLSFATALRTLLSCPVAIDTPDSLAHPDGSGSRTVPVPMPAVTAPKESAWTTPSTASITASSGSARA